MPDSNTPRDPNAPAPAPGDQVPPLSDTRAEGLLDAAAENDAPLPTVLAGINPEELFARGMGTVQMSGAAGGMWQPPSPEEAAKLFPNYEVLSLLGRGGMGAVYKARQIELDRPVAIKLLPLEISADRDFAERFRREARAMAKLNHPNIISVYDFGTTSEGHLFFVMEFVDGANLHQIIHGPGLDPAQTLAITIQVCEALAYAHEQGVIHRDIKPANVMVDQRGRAKVADFGLARLTDPAAEQLGHTMTGAVMGTPDYMAPEQMRGMNVDHRADIYSLGVMLYEMLCKDIPRGFFDPPSQRTGVDSRFDDVVKKAMQQQPERRYQQTTEMRTDVDQIRATMVQPTPSLIAAVEGSAPSLPPAGIDSAMPSNPARKSKAGIMLATVALSIIIGFIVAYVWKPIGGPGGAPVKTAQTTGGTPAPLSPSADGWQPLFTEAEWRATDKKDREYKDGHLHVKRGGVFKNQPSPDGAIRAVVRLREGATDASVRMRDTQQRGGDAEGGYRFTLYKTWEKVGLSTTPSQADKKGGKTLGEKVLPRPLKVGDTITLELRVQGKHLTASANGVVMIETDDASISMPGMWGVSANDGWFESVEVQTLPSAGAKPVASALRADSSAQRADATPATATKDAPFVNTLGMKFVPVPIGGGATKGQLVLFGVWDVRVQDYAAYAAANPQADGSWKTQAKDDVPAGREPDHPVVGVSWDDARAFCQWLTEKETAEGRLPQGMKYRLPSDEEWSWAVGLPPEQGATPAEKSGKNSVDFPWGKDWPPRQKVGNYLDETFHAKFPPKKNEKENRMENYRWMEGYVDDYATTSPVGSYPANVYGLYDMGGNVWQWCEDSWDKDQNDRVLRGGSWFFLDRNLLLSSARFNYAHDTRATFYGFRCVVAGSMPASSGISPTPAPAGSAAATKDASFVNSLGMKFVPVPITGGPTHGQRVLFSVWETRVQDYDLFARETKREWPKPDFEQGPTHPAVNVSWEDATAFCAWLTELERKAGRLGAKELYRLPTDHEWSCAAEIGEREDAGKLPGEKNQQVADAFPWGSAWPPPKGAGNYAGEELQPALAAGKSSYIKGIIPGYRDGFVNTSPVGSFAANRFGLFDMGGNVWQWCEDWFNKDQEMRLLRGGAWSHHDRGSLLSSHRSRVLPAYRGTNNGFRCVLAPSTPSSAPAAANVPPPAPTTAKQTIDLLALVDVTKDKLKAEGLAGANQWSKSGGRLAFKWTAADGKSGKICAPVSLNGLRDYEIEAEVPKPVEALTLDFPTSPGSQGTLDFFADKGVSIAVDENRRRYQISEWPKDAGSPKKIAGRVHFDPDGINGTISATLNGKPAGSWHGPLTKLGKPVETHPDFPGQLVPALFVFRGELEYSSWTLRVFEGEAKVLRAPGGAAAGGGSWIDLIAAGGWDSHWKVENGVLTRGGRVSNRYFPQMLRDSALRVTLPWDGGGPRVQLGLREQDDGSFLRLQLLRVGDSSQPRPITVHLDHYQTLTKLTSGSDGQTTREYKIGDEVTVELRAVGGEVSASVDGQIVASLRDPDQHPGKAYVYSSSPDPAVFRRLELLDLDSASASAPGNPASASLSTPATATKDAPFVNTLGMKFVPVLITGGLTDKQRVLFSVWETRVQDYDLFAKETKREWPKPDFEQGPTHPAVNVSWEDATAFCAWLTEHERKAGKLAASEVYRLPSDHEWSCAAGIGAREDAAKTPEEKNFKVSDAFPWGSAWPPPENAGNYASEELRPLLAAGKYSDLKYKAIIGGYHDDYATTSPVGTFSANAFGLYDMGGNVWQWCEDWYNYDRRSRVVRGASWANNVRNFLLLSCRGDATPAVRYSYHGFRVVLAPAKP